MVSVCGGSESVQSSPEHCFHLRRACGVLAYEVVTGEPPFNAAANNSMTKDLIQKCNVPLSGTWPMHLSPELKDFIKRVTAFDPLAVKSSCSPGHCLIFW